MTTVQLKSEIHKAIDNVPENALPELLKFITSIQHQSPDTSLAELAMAATSVAAVA